MVALDLICWDFGDTLVDERFMRIPPAGVPEWTAARELLGFDVDLSTKLLIDNKQMNSDEFVAAGGTAFHFDRERFAAEAETMLGPLVS